LKKGESVLAIIPARGGSKGVPGKNIKLLCGKSLIAYTIDAAQAARSIDRLILSTDNEEIAELSEKFGVEIPFMRLPKLAKDTSLAIDNYIYTVDRLNAESSKQYDDFIVLQPTSPFRTAVDIDNAVELFREKNADSVISVCEDSHPPVWAKKIDPSGVLRDYFDINIDNKNRQELEPSFMPNGAIFILKLSLIKSHYSYYSDKTYAYVMPSERSVDIDTFFDFEFAEFLMSRNTSRKGNEKSGVRTSGSASLGERQKWT
jgi:N-acylneuraminate cytidylyltransferase/CMP-N,N'-diacetyllegionaminic acid synthase